MRCPYCGFEESRVLDTRTTDDGDRIRRRRECNKCLSRFTTYEVIEKNPIIVVKRDLSREPFNREKLLNGLMRACEKRPVSTDTLEAMVDRIESELENTLEREVSSRAIGELAMEHLRFVDEIAYVRFASVYRQFKDISSFVSELNRLLR